LIINSKKRKDVIPVGKKSYITFPIIEKSQNKIKFSQADKEISFKQENIINEKVFDEWTKL